MISKPLFKQSCKANAWSWTFVTAITCFMLAILIVVLGGIDVNAIRSTMVDMFVTDAVEANVDEQSMTYFNLTTQALSNYEENSQSVKQGFDGMGALPGNYKEQVTSLYIAKMTATGVQEKINGKDADEQRKIAKECHKQAKAEVLGTLKQNPTLEQMLKGDALVLLETYEDYLYFNKGDKNYTDDLISAFVMNQIGESIYEQVEASSGAQDAQTARFFIDQALNSFLDESNAVKSPEAFASNYIPQVLGEVLHKFEFKYDGDTIKISDFYNEQELVDMSESAIIAYSAQMSAKSNQLLAEKIAQNNLLPEGERKTEEVLKQEVEVEMIAYADKFIESQGETLLETFPPSVAEALQELGSLDIYALVIGSIFFRIAGLLLPIIYIIMTANNLIASQVDSGSMAYVLSTPTKRISVSLTQMLYLITSLLGMFICTTITGLVSLAFAGSAMTISFTDMLLFNLGAFITTFAISGICFLASSWFNRSKHSMAVGGGLSMFFLVATILGLFGSSVMPQAIRIDAMNSFNYVSIISLFDTVSIMAGNLTFLWKLAILVGIGVVTYAISVKKFEKKDLPL